MEKKKWSPCWCKIALGILIVVFTWYDFGYSKLIITACGVAVVIIGFINKCCCADEKGDKGPASCC